MKRKIRNIIFDLGGVLVDLDFMGPIKEFSKLGANQEQFDYHDVISDPVFLYMEMGLITPAEFRDHIRQKLKKNELTDGEIDHAWCSLLGSVPAQKVALLQHLGTKYRLFLYSNTNAIHIGYFKERFFSEHAVEFESLFEKAFYSHDIHDRKPQLSGYEKVFAGSGIVPQETLFVDDFIQNIEAARSAGMQVYHYTPGTDLALFFSGM
jgi:glucose-1-phosphatase